ncbi:hypothetical protein CGSSp23BS72_09065 [Streptococcus pneumoniae SP23-BS72]|nr:hypothetical protein CGSSp11BS70_01964 [Streptococcus pneumoniae SP11-BS70]EDK64868.1 hypothetical protein CGSSp14BS69_05847 [Streptococcus pneumoniae SP14-BS69]EDK67382.1 ribonucleotide-diphosphate reductase subunit alpha [Streptococcus pneumoniae SP18-BS74]EDK69883.1 ribonucleotide-diphosphate reductase subunit alpha [Streptococcus pneumoniae SP19-BS75]EDK75377.1 hypothetical protein CGSSp6BS73_03521 [Streptococcus pneumoniae SP6-BS73]EDK80255.1 hypothetical protein CGSSp23BS72_09065 [Str
MKNESLDKEAFIFIMYICKILDKQY